MVQELHSADVELVLPRSTQLESPKPAKGNRTLPDCVTRATHLRRFVPPRHVRQPDIGDDRTEAIGAEEPHARAPGHVADFRLHHGVVVFAPNSPKTGLDHDGSPDARISTRP